MASLTLRPASGSDEKFTVADATPEKPKKKTEFMDLPTEIRQLIYNEVFEGATIAYERVRVQVGNAHCFFLKLRADETSNHRNMLMTCKTIYEGIERYRQNIGTVVILDKQRVEEGPLITKKPSGQVGDFVFDGSLEVISSASKLELLRLPPITEYVDVDAFGDESADEAIFQEFQQHLHTYVPDFDSKPGQIPIQVMTKINICKYGGASYCGDYNCCVDNLYYEQDFCFNTRQLVGEKGDFSLCP